MPLILSILSQLPATINDGIEPLCLPTCICQCLSEALFGFYFELTFRVHRLVQSRLALRRPRARFCLHSVLTVLQAVLSKKMNPFQLTITLVFSYLHITSSFLIIPRKKRIAIVFLSETPENQFATASERFNARWNVMFERLKKVQRRAWQLSGSL
jgi:hypothetical protein